MPGTKTLVAGWGRVHTYGPFSSTPNEVYLNVVRNEECSRRYNGSSVQGLICAGAKGRDICDWCFPDDQQSESPSSASCSRKESLLLASSAFLPLLSVKYGKHGEE
ncbi:hypothetical protein V5799_006552 [Amblyomma americanum]|uniref:Peptidase S1 domain-containing protein n=1 Tax=Amblyomma americanum TaxID=6943 RepID=A0AAQ4DW27_AMBAM